MTSATTNLDLKYRSNAICCVLPCRRVRFAGLFFSSLAVTFPANCMVTDECMSSGTYTEPLNYATNFNVPLLIHIVVCSSGLKQRNMNIYLGNVTFDRVFDETGYKLTEEDRSIWNKYHSNKADLSEKDSCFHIFSMPLEIHFKGEEAKEALFKMFTPDKCVEAKGYFNMIRKS